MDLAFDSTCTPIRLRHVILDGGAYVPHLPDLCLDAAATAGSLYAAVAWRCIVNSQLRTKTLVIARQSVIRLGLATVSPVWRGHA